MTEFMCGNFPETTYVHVVLDSLAQFDFILKPFILQWMCLNTDQNTPYTTHYFVETMYKYF